MQHIIGRSALDDDSRTTVNHGIPYLPNFVIIRIMGKNYLTLHFAFELINYFIRLWFHGVIPFISVKS
jgi:hypothetical protein